MATISWSAALRPRREAKATSTAPWPAWFDVGRAAVEHGRDRLAGGGGVPVELADQPADGPVGVVPPAVGPRPDQVHAVDQPAWPVAGPARHLGPVLYVTAHSARHRIGLPPGPLLPCGKPPKGVIHMDETYSYCSLPQMLPARAPGRDRPGTHRGDPGQLV
jgi:hypothetical protein